MVFSAKRRVVLIDNYDSFTWNLYEYLCQEGAEVLVYRNDQITLEEIDDLKPDCVFISPGPGHPRTDSGISRDCVRHFAGKIPVVGVCMGLQCMFDVFGGTVSYAGEIVHGKTSQVTHDNKGIFKDIPQGVAVSRYHSLAGEPLSLPEVLEVTARTENGIIMGVRHKNLTVEGVQFHPESILTEAGHVMVRNILNIQGGTWEEHEKLSKEKRVKGSSILDKIYAQRQKDVDELSATPGFTLRDLQSNFNQGLAPEVQDFYTKLSSGPKSAVIAEIKRASPSKGDIDMNAIAAEQGLKYAKAGASAISVLTEPHWFKGSIQDLVNVRRALDIEFKNAPQDRPCVLRKEFIFSKYQILEARLAGADSVLLIVKMLSQDLLLELYNYSKFEVGIEPLVEVSSKEEMGRALELNAKVVGVNNRDLHSFNVDLNTTSSLASSVPEGTILLALSGITSGADAEKYKKEGVKGLLVGEALMRAANVDSLIKDLSA
ncbi:bifunctional anthranilate synthase/indole-3-glycerol-phosphate synthase [Lachancea thermotolerans CBS 6340]|uniref:Multifunctional tryptophan biosynthesis protein n=1 Tax=Lachancea thermotolerans (strain ATCC 56472 / CBS 6340 / NRRL Y-8284) TaxID=559295 RepID=C5DC85_LACTC|nr:KLTH0B00968p [Lachancea thermotolerans CBS 6340]CAR21396.1 KLTH0B00968p [Lachancea thermotolerans CBS 6340]